MKTMKKTRGTEKVWKVLVAFVAIAMILSLVLPFLNY